jgi:hypothetical protein
MTSLFRAAFSAKKDKDSSKGLPGSPIRAPPTPGGGMGAAATDYYSSDEDDNETLAPADDKDSFRYPVYLVNSQRHMDFVVDVVKAILYQKSQKGIKMISCADIIKVNVDADKNQVTIDIKGKDSLLSKQKMYNFAKGKALEFQALIEFIKNDGDNIRYMYGLFDKLKMRCLSRGGLAKALKEFELAADPHDVEKM